MLPPQTGSAPPHVRASALLPSHAGGDAALLSSLTNGGRQSDEISSKNKHQVISRLRRSVFAGGHLRTQPRRSKSDISDNPTSKWCAYVHTLNLVCKWNEAADSVRSAPLTSGQSPDEGDFGAGRGGGGRVETDST